MTNDAKEVSLFKEWFDACWSGDGDISIPTEGDGYYPEYVEKYQVALGAWMERARISQARVEELEGFLREDYENVIAIQIERPSSSGCTAHYSRDRIGRAMELLNPAPEEEKE